MARIPSWLWILISGIVGGLASTGSTTYHVLGFVAYIPLLLVLDRIVQNPQTTRKQKFFRVVLSCWATAVIMAPMGAHWMINSIHVFGHMPWFVAVMITSLIFGIEVTLILWFCFGLPAFLVKNFNGWDIPFRLFFFLVADWLYPRFFQWSFGEFALLDTPWIEQAADLVGAWGLGFFSIGFNFLLLMLWRHFQTPGDRPQNKLKQQFAFIYVGLLILGTSYGAWRSSNLQSLLSEGTALNIASIQPNFSLKRLASNPDLAYSDRESNIWDLLNDSQKALAPFVEQPEIPKLVVWPESTFPFPINKSPQVQEIVRNFSQENNTSILLHSVDWDKGPIETKYYGTSQLVGKDGELKDRYDKVFLIPFGEYIPGADWFPAYRKWLREMVPNMSEFTAGKEYTVFQVDGKIPVSGAICFDAFSPNIMRNMAREGANLIVNLNNLAWFGKSNASQMMEMALRWHAIENRVPFLTASNNGQSMFIDVLGKRNSEALPLFEEGALSETVFLRDHMSFYREYKEAVHGFVVLLLMLCTWGAFRKKVFSKESQ